MHSRTPVELVGGRAREDGAAALRACDDFINRTASSFGFAVYAAGVPGVTFVTVASSPVFGESPCFIRCPNCQNEVTTTVRVYANIGSLCASTGYSGRVSFAPPSRSRRRPAALPGYSASSSSSSAAFHGACVRVMQAACGFVAM